MISNLPHRVAHCIQIVQLVPTCYHLAAAEWHSKEE